MQSIYVPKYDIHYRINPKNPCELQWSKKPFGPMTAWQKAFTFTKPIRALDIDDDTQQGVVVLNDSSTYVGSGVRVWGRKYYTAGSRLYSLYAIGESKMKSKMKIRVHEKITDDGVIHNVPLHKRAIKDMLKDMHDEDDTENKYNPNDPIVVNDYLNDTAIVTVEWVLTHLGEGRNINAPSSVRTKVMPASPPAERFNTTLCFLVRSLFAISLTHLRKNFFHQHIGTDHNGKQHNSDSGRITNLKALSAVVIQMVHNGVRRVVHRRAALMALDGRLASKSLDAL